MTGQKLPLKCSVDYISFSAHTDYKQTSEFVRILKPSHIVSPYSDTLVKYLVLEVIDITKVLI